jgi:PIN domain nuclease of toxin-antitoxin system
MKLQTGGGCCVLDTSALIPLERRERGWEKVDAALETAVICAVNLTESITKLLHKSAEARVVERCLTGPCCGGSAL